MSRNIIHDILLSTLPLLLVSNKKEKLAERIIRYIEINGYNEQLEALLTKVLHGNTIDIPKYENIFLRLTKPKPVEKKIAISFKDLKRETENNMCAICLEKYNESDIIEIRPCSHIFHKSCLSKWPNNCPCCRHA
jgi:hypothetical protein